MTDNVFSLRAGLGLALWIGVGVLAAVWITRGFAEPGRAADQLWRFFTTPRRVVELEFDQTMLVRVGDPIFVQQQGQSVRIGEIARVVSRDSIETLPVYADRAYAVLYAAAPQPAGGDYLTLHHTPSSLDWTVRMMLPAETRDQIQRMIAEAIQQHQPQMLELLGPIVEASLREAWVVAEEDFQVAVARRQEQIEELVARYEQELLRQQLIPLLGEEVWPIIQRRAAPTVERIGQHIWARVSYWRFGTSLVRDVIPFTPGTATRREFERFVQTEAQPIIEAHADELLMVLQLVVEDAFRNQQIRDVVSRSLRQVIEDPEFQQLMADILHEVIIDNPRFRTALTDPWRTERAEAALQQINRWLEPTINEIGIELFGSPETEITPEFARVLRERILLKDMRWLMLHQAGGSTDSPDSLPVYLGPTDTENPFHIPARR